MPPQTDWTAEIAKRFHYHAPDIHRVFEHKAVREDFIVLAEKMAEALPEGREKASCFTDLEEAMFWANAAIARQEVK